MKAKACTKCRQWKARCDYKGGVESGCSRCQSLSLPCVFDATFRRTSKAKSIQRMSQELQRLRQVLDGTTVVPDSSNTRAESTDGTLLSNNVASQVCSVPPEIIQPSVESLGPQDGGCVAAQGVAQDLYRTVDGVMLTAGQVKEHFKTYFTRCHHYIPFKMTTQSPEAIYSRCPLLFWVICAAAANWKLKSQLSPSLKIMLAETIHSPTRSIEKVQALLIMSSWPSSVTAIIEDPSDFYCGIATQMALQLGLHRPCQSHIHAYGSEEHISSKSLASDVQTTTWQACFVVNQRQFLVRGVPQSVWADPLLLKSFEDDSIDPVLPHLGRIYLLLMRANLAIGGEGDTPSGMMEPGARLAAIKLWDDRFSTLEAQRLGHTNEVVDIAFTSSRMQVLSFVLLDDMPVSVDLLDFVERAKQDACHLIELCYGRNLAIAPAHVRHAISYSGFVLVKILRSSYCTESEVLQDSIERVRQMLSTTTSSLDDTYRKACQTIQWLMYVEDKKLSPPIYTRMGASVIYDLLRICAEHRWGPTQENDEQSLDLDGIDWNVWDWLV